MSRSFSLLIGRFSVISSLKLLFPIVQIEKSSKSLSGIWLVKGKVDDNKQIAIYEPLLSFENFSILSM